MSNKKSFVLTGLCAVCLAQAPNKTPNILFLSADHAEQVISTYEFAQDDDLRSFPAEADPKEVGSRLVQRFLETPYSLYGNPRPPHRPSHVSYPEVCTWLGALWFAKAAKNDHFAKQLDERFFPLMGADSIRRLRRNHVDFNVLGVIPLELYLQTKKPEYLKLGMTYADTQWQVPDDATPEQKAWADKGYSWQTRLMIDDMFMITAIQAQAFRATSERKYIDGAAAEMVLYLDELQQPNGLFYHSPVAKYFWGRGNGWLAVGMSELLRILPDDNPNKPRILEAYRKMMKTLKEHQGNDGIWHQLIDENDELTEVCEGTGDKDDYQYYIDRKRIVGDLHGQAPMIWCAYALINKYKK